MDEDCRLGIEEILCGKVVGRRVCHLWFDEDTKTETLYHGQIVKYLKKRGPIGLAIGLMGRTMKKTMILLSTNL